MKNNTEMHTFLPEHSAASEYITWLQDITCNEDALFIEKYKKIVKEQKDTDTTKPFLSVITRTQGKRPEMLRETLLSLTGQSDIDFEVILIGHKLDEKGLIAVKQLIDELPSWMNKKVRFVELNDGNRTTPLNYGFAYASGQYISILDDDDIVFDNWVEEFHRALECNNGRILHSYVLSQNWEVVKLENGQNALRAVSAPESLFCRDFDIHEQIRMNHCPVMGLAFPAFFFKECGMIFDEELTTTEDWDYLMRIAFIAGVTDIQVPTAIYRLWNNSNNSHMEHDSSEWDENYQKIQKKLEQIPEIIPAGVSKLVVYDDAATAQRKNRNLEAYFVSNKLYIATSSSGFSEDTAIITDVFFDNKNRLLLKYTIPEKYGNLTAIRFDPCFEGSFCLKKLKIVLVYADGSQIADRSQMKHNGFETNDGVLFSGIDPQIVVQTDYGRIIKSVDIIADAEIEMLGEMIKQAIDKAVFKHYCEIENSNSWRITKPLRAFIRFLKRAKKWFRKL